MRSDSRMQGQVKSRQESGTMKLRDRLPSPSSWSGSILSNLAANAIWAGLAVVVAVLIVVWNWITGDTGGPLIAGVAICVFVVVFAGTAFISKTLKGEPVNRRQPPVERRDSNSAERFHDQVFVFRGEVNLANLT